MLLLILAPGCKKSTPPEQTAPPSSTLPHPSSSGLVARIHWLGKKRLAAETNAAYFMSIWNMPESARLEAQTLDKLATAPWRLLSRTASSLSPTEGERAGVRGPQLSTNQSTINSPLSTNQPTIPALIPIGASPLLRPLLDDIVQSESYLEIREKTNQSGGEVAFAIRLDGARAKLWETNLAAVLESLTGLDPSSIIHHPPSSGPGWRLQITNHESRITNQPSSTIHHPPSLVELTRAGDWTLVGLAQDQNDLLKDFAARIQSTRAPFTASPTNFWVDADFDLGRVARSIPRYLKLPDEFPRTSLTMIGDGENVRTRGQLDFPKPLSLDLKPWNIPTNLIRDPLVGLTAIRGVRPYLELLKLWRDLDVGDAPNQLYSWTLAGTPFQTYIAAEQPNARNRLRQLTDRLVQDVNPWLGTNGMGVLKPATNGNGIAWVEIPFLTPFLSSSGDFVYCGFFPGGPTNRPPPAELLREITRTTLIYYDWEITEARIEGLLHIGQLLRLALHKAQLLPGSAGLAWLLAAGPRLGNCTTEITKIGSNELHGARKSSCGLTASELHLLADWLESPQFPYSLHALVSVQTLPGTSSQTNSTAPHH